MKYYLVGIKGTGMSSLAKMLKENQHEVIGSDVKEYYFTVDGLEKYEIPILPFARENIKDGYYYIIGNAYNKDNIEVDEIINRKLPYAYYHDFIGKALKKDIIACSGTHGKTTTSYFLKEMLDEKCNFIIGDGEGGGYPNDILVLEACEYKEHFLSYQPKWLIINNIELDHTDYYRSKKQVLNAFQKFANLSDMVLVNGDDPNAKKIKHDKKISFGFHKNNDIVIRILSTTSKGYYVKVMYEENIYLFVPYLGKHMIYDYVASYMTLYILGYQPKELSHHALPRRRLTTYTYQNAICIDDYAHHPTEIKALYETLQLTYPNVSIKVIFQPHTYERTLYFKKKFKSVLSLFDEVYLLDVFTSKREKENKLLQHKIDKYFEKFKKIDELNFCSIGKKKEIWLFLGAGSANQILRDLCK
jgi:UDP-N-acetylmuramate--L-alanine ligase